MTHEMLLNNQFYRLSKSDVDNYVDSMWISVDNSVFYVDNFLGKMDKCGNVDKCLFLSTGYPHPSDHTVTTFV